jgi:aspartyl protease family protein
VGVVTIRMEVRRDGGPSREVEFLVDSGATLSVLPWTVWRALGLRPKRVMRFALADGRTIRRRTSECRFCYEGLDATSPVVLGQRKDAALLGTLTLESLGLVLNPFERRLRPMRMLLA